MSNKINQNRLKTENSSTYASQIYPKNHGYNYSLTNISDPPSTYYSKIKNEKEGQYQNFSNIERYSHPQRYINSNKNIPKNTFIINKYKRNTEKIGENKELSQKKSFQTSQKYENHSFYSSNTKNSVGIEKKYDNKTAITYRHNKTKSNEKNNSHEINYNKNNNSKYKTNNNSMNTNNARYITNINNLNYKERKTITNVINTRNDRNNKLNEPINRRHYINKSYEGIKIPPKYYRNNPLISSNLRIKPNIGKKDEKAIIKPVAQKICNIIIKGGEKKEEKKDNDEDKKNDEQENDEEEEEEMEGEEEEDDNSEEKNSSSPIMKIQRTQSIEQPRDIKTKSLIVSKKNILKIEKLKNSNFELPKTPTGTLIQMQKAQSFEQPSEVNFNKNRAKKFEMTQLKDCEVELINKPNYAVDEELKIEKNKVVGGNINQNQKKNKIDVTSIPKPDIIDKKISKFEEKNTEIKYQPRTININPKINNNESQKNKLSQQKIVIMNKRSNSNDQPRIETKVEKENPNRSNNISHYNNSNSSNLNSNSNDNSNKNDKEKKPELINKNISLSIPNSTKKAANEDINKNQPVNLNSRRNYSISISSNNNERPRSSQKNKNVNTKPTTKVNKYITTVITVISPKRDLSKDKSKNEKGIEKKNSNFPLINIKKDINEVKNKKEIKPKEVNVQNKSCREYTNPKDNNIKIEIINTDIDTPRKTNYINRDINDKNDYLNYDIKKEKVKDNKDLCFKDKKRIPISNDNRSHTFTIISNSGRNEENNQERIYETNKNQRANSREKVKVKNNNKSKIGITYISNINNK